MRKAARTVKPNARTGERHTWKDRERRRMEERQRMAAEALKELGLMKPLEPEQTAQYKFSDLQMSLYYTIYI